MKGLFLLAFFLTGFYSSFSQTQIKGVVTDSLSHPIPRVTILVSKPTSNVVKAYTFSDKQGRYQIRFALASDSVLIEVQAMGFSSVKRKIRNTSQTIDFSLNSQAIVLDEVIVKAPKPIVQRGDTLVYKVSAFTQVQDRSIGDVIEHMPGVEVKSDGEIYYQGKPINKYYVEGMDMLGGRYSIINENLPGYEVAEVQILKHHQSVKVLDSVTFSEQAAINLKLKKKHVFTGQAKVGGGASPFLWDVNITPMLFTKESQFLGSYQTNNTGHSIQSQLVDHTGGSSVSMGGGLGANWLHIQRVSAPGFRAQRWLDNNAHLGSFNFITKLKKEQTLKGFASYYNGYLQQYGTAETRFFTPTDTIRLQEEQYNQTYKESFRTGLTFEKNAAKNYVKDKLIFSGRWDQARGQLLKNGENTVQNRSNTTYKLGNSLKIITPIGNQLFHIRSNIALSKTPQKLRVSPGQFVDLLNNGIDYDRSFQNLEVKTFYAAHSLGLTKEIGKFNFHSKLGFDYRTQRLTSQLFTSTNNSLGIPFKNDLKWNQAVLYFDLRTRFYTNGWKISLSTPLRLKTYSLEDEGHKENKEINRFLFDPRLSITRFIGDHWELSASAGTGHSIGNIRRFHYGFIMSGYRNIGRINAAVPITSNQRVGIGVEYENPLAGIFGNAGISFSHRKNNLLYKRQILPNGTTEITAVQKDNFGGGKEASGELTKLFWGIETKVTFKASYAVNNSQLRLNGVLSDMQITKNTYSVEVDPAFSDWFNLKYAAGIAFSNSEIHGEKQRQVSSQVHQAVLNFHLFNKHNLGVDLQYYRNNYSSDNDQFFSDAFYRFSLKKKHLDFELMLTNIFNTETYQTTSLNRFGYIETNYRLRPRQLLVRVRFSF